MFISDAQWFAKIYNEELHSYRLEHRIRSANHPVADLLSAGDLVELPFWAWRAGSMQRGRLCIRKQYSKIDLICYLAGKEMLISSQDSGPGTQTLPPGWKIRPKALITSMMFRLFLADLFVHGIGGAIYDELTDRIFKRYWKVTLPRFAIVTATLRLPWNREPVTDATPRRIRQTLRGMQWNPDRYLSEPMSETANQLKKQKLHLITTPAVPEELTHRHTEYERIRMQLAPLVSRERSQLDNSLSHAIQQLKKDEHQFSREHPWVLFPKESLQILLDSKFT